MGEPKVIITKTWAEHQSEKEKEAQKEGVTLIFKTALEVLPFALLFIGAGLIYAENLSIGVILIVIGLIWIAFRHKIKSVKLIVLGILTIASFFYLFGTLAYPLSRYSLENRVISGVVTVVCGFLFYRIMKNKKKKR